MHDRILYSAGILFCHSSDISDLSANEKSQILSSNFGIQTRGSLGPHTGPANSTPHRRRPDPWYTHRRPRRRSVQMCIYFIRSSPGSVATVTNGMPNPSHSGTIYRPLLVDKGLRSPGQKMGTADPRKTLQASIIGLDDPPRGIYIEQSPRSASRRENCLFIGKQPFSRCTVVECTPVGGPLNKLKL